MSNIDKSSEDYKHFLVALNFALKWEGGYSNHSADVGGLTYKGITQGSWDSFVKRNPTYKQKPVPQLTTDEVNEFYYIDRWKSVFLDPSVPYPLNVAVFDVSVNFNQDVAWAYVNEVLNPKSARWSLTKQQQQAIKKQALDLIKNGKITAERLTQLALERRLTEHYKRADDHPSQKVFLDGWVNRTRDLGRLVGVENLQRREPISYDRETKLPKNIISDTGFKNENQLDFSSDSPSSSSPSPSSSPSSSSPSSSNTLEEEEDSDSSSRPSRGSTNNPENTNFSIVENGLYMIRSTFERFPIPQDMRIRKIFGGYKLNSSRLINVGANSPVSGPGLGSSSSDNSEDTNLEFDFGGTWGDPIPDANYFTSGYQRVRGSRPHPGIDIASGPVGVDVISTADGKVVDTCTGYCGGFGNFVVIEHNAGNTKIYSSYNHLKDDTLLVKIGDIVTKGQKLGTEGTTGFSTGIHLHFELRTTKGSSRSNFLSTHFDPSCVLERWKQYCSYNNSNGANMMPPTVSSDLPSLEEVKKRKAEASSSENSDSTSSTSGTARRLKVPYKSQLDNLYNPKGACNVTSIAMCLEYLNIPRKNIKYSQFEDELYRYTLDKDYDRHKPEDLARLVRDYGAKDNFTRHAKIKDVQEWIDKGYPAVIHGYFTTFGHVIVVVGYDKNGFIVHDPNGKWFPSGYKTDLSGAYLHYSYKIIRKLCIPDGKFYVHFISK